MSSSGSLADAIEAVGEIKKNPSPENCPQCYKVLGYLYVGSGTLSIPVPKSARYESIDALLSIPQDENRLSTEIILALLEEGGYVEKEEVPYLVGYRLTKEGIEFMQNSNEESDSS